MRHLLLLLVTITLVACGGKDKERDKTAEKSEKIVYICTGGSSERYHASDDCRGLCRCKGDIKGITMAEAQDMGRTPCKICY